VYLNSNFALVFWVVGLLIMTVSRERAGERGLLLSALALAIIGAIAISLDSTPGTEAFQFLGAALVGAVLGLFTRRRFPLAGAVIVAVLLSILALIVIVFSIFRW
jgi:hypothetical protein